MMLSLIIGNEDPTFFREKCDQYEFLALCGCFHIQALALLEGWWSVYHISRKHPNTFLCTDEEDHTSLGTNTKQKPSLQRFCLSLLKH